MFSPVIILYTFHVNITHSKCGREHGRQKLVLILIIREASSLLNDPNGVCTEILNWKF